MNEEPIYTKEYRQEAIQYAEVGRFLLANSKRVKVNDSTTFLIKNKNARFNEE